jgi:hypothetical protein
VSFSAQSEGPDLEGGGVHDQSDVRQDEEQPCNHFIAFTLFPSFFQHFFLEHWCCFMCCKSLYTCVANLCISMLQMVLQIITTSIY